VEDNDERLQRALAVGHGYLNRRDRTEAEMRRRLAGAGIDEATTDQAIGVLVQQGMLDDSRYARLFTQDKRELEQWGNDRIRRTLLERGIDRELVEQTLGAEPTESDSEFDRALALLRHRFSGPPRDRRERDRALGVMLRKGYDSELALDVLAAYSRVGNGP
jgi:regulatory protein